MSLPARLAVIGLLAITLAPLARSQTLPTDPSLVSGQLDNGLHYIVKQHKNPASRSAIWLHMGTGSLNETDRQRGIAHYLEHMAFNGSENFPPGSVVPFFQSLGLTFGRDQNAFTNMQQTTFQLALPDTDPEVLAKGMTFFADVLFRLSLTPKEIDAERQIIQEERRRGLSGRQRTGFYITEHMTPGSLYGQRITIGTEETINGVKESDFRDYYGKWYTASNATLIVVSDAQPADVVKVIKDKFAAAPKRDKPAPQPLNVKAYDKNFAIVASDPEVRSEDVRILRLEPAHPPVTTVPQYRDQLVLRLGEMALNRRLENKAAKGDTAYLNGRVGVGNEAGAIHTAEISGRAAPGKWKPALEQLALELQRARAFGFSARELDDARKQLISGAERSAETEATQPTQAVIGRINNTVAAGEPVMSPQQQLGLLKELLPSIKSEEVAARFSAEFDPKAVAFIAVLPSGGDVPTDSQLVEIGTKALAVTPAPETETAHASQLMAELPKPGKVAEGAEHQASKVWSGWLSNNVRVHYRFMDERKNQVNIGIALYGGELLETADNRAITQAAQLAWSRPSTKQLSSTEIRELMTGKKVNVRGGGGFGGGGGRGGRGGGGGGSGGGADSITLSISGSPEDLETGFQLAYLLLTEPKIEPAPFSEFQTNMRQMLQESGRNPSALGARTAAAAIYPESEPRTRPPTAEEIDRLTLSGSQAWLDKLIKESPIEVAIVGDITKDKALEFVTRYLGSLPPRDRISPAAFQSQRKITRPAGPRTIEKSVDSPTPQAFVYSGFYAADESNIADVRALNMAARVLSTRMVTEVREHEQLVYSIGAASRPATTFPGFGVFSAAAPTDPQKVSALVAKLASMYEAFAKEGPTGEEMSVAKKQMANTFEEQVKDPAYWFARLEKMDFRNLSLDDFLAAPDAYQSMTPKQVQDAFKKYYSKENSIVVVVKPEAAKPDKAPDNIK